MTTSSPSASRTALILAFAAIYLIWGSTYLAIRVAVETLPPFLLTGARFITAGLLVFLWLSLKGRARLTRQQWMAYTVSGTLLLMGGNALVVWAEQRIPSGITTLIISVSPLIMVLLDWMLPKGTRPSWLTLMGLALGFGGLVLLLGGGVPGGPLDFWRCAGVLLACLCWCSGSLYSRYSKHGADPLTGSAVQMLTSGVLMVLVAVGRGELHDFSWRLVSARSLWAWTYLVVAGSLVAFPCYVYLLTHTTPARASTYAYVNPIVAVFLGWLILNEAVTQRTLLAAAVIIVAVIIITTQKGRKK